MVNVIKYRVDFSKRLTKFKFIDLQIDKTLLEKGVEKFNLKLNFITINIIQRNKYRKCCIFNIPGTNFNQNAITVFFI